MAVAAAGILAGVELALKALPIAERMINWITETIKKAREAGVELTPAQEAEYQAWQARVLASPHAQIRPDPSPPA